MLGRRGSDQKSFLPPISRLGPSPEARKSGCRVASAEGGIPCRTIRTSALTFEPVGGTHSRALLSAYGQQLRPRLSAPDVVASTVLTESARQPAPRATGGWSAPAPSPS